MTSAAESVIAIIGLGTIGEQELRLWLGRARHCIGVDVSDERVAMLRKLFGDPSQCTLSCDAHEALSADVIILCLPSVDDAGDMTLRAFDSVQRMLATDDLGGRLVILATFP